MKQKIKDKVFSKTFDSDYYEVKFSDLPENIGKDDIINIHREEAFYSENNSYDAHTELMVFTEREETEEEYQKRLNENKEFQEMLKKRRYENYLKLKAEFETQ